MGIRWLVVSLPVAEGPQRSGGGLQGHARGLLADHDRGALVLPDVKVGMIEASATRRPAIACIRSSSSTTANGSLPIRHVPTG